AEAPICGRVLRSASGGSPRAHFKEVVVLKLKLLLLAVVGAIAVGQTLAVAADNNPQPVDFTHNVMNAPAPVDGASFGTGPAVQTGTAICTTASQIGNANTDCETTSAGPHNETSI